MAIEYWVLAKVVWNQRLRKIRMRKISGGQDSRDHTLCREKPGAGDAMAGTTDLHPGSKVPPLKKRTVSLSQSAGS